MTYSNEQLALKKHIECVNAENSASYSTDLYIWSKREITTINHWEHYILSSDAYELYLSVWGIKPRHIDFDILTIADLKAMVLGLESDLITQELNETEAKESNRLELQKRKENNAYQPNNPFSSLSELLK